MKKLKKINKTIEETTVVEKVICDICKKECHSNSVYEASKIQIEAQIGEVYPEGDSRTLYIIDVCKDCFLDKIKPLIEENLGIKFRTLDSEDRFSKHEYEH